MATANQQTLPAFAAGKDTATVTQTVVLSLETSNRKNEKVQTAIDECQNMCSHLADMMASIPEHERGPNNPALYRLLNKAFPPDERTVHSKTAKEVTRHVAAAFESWRARGRPGDWPQFGNSPIVLLDKTQLSITENEQGYGVKAKLIPYSAEWFHADPRPYNAEYLERICEGEAEYGSAELRLVDGKLTLHLPVSWDIDVYAPEEVNTTIGVDIGENVIYAAAVVSGGAVERVEMKDGSEYRHYRERLKEKRNRLQQQGDRRAVLKCKNERERYTEQVLDTASRKVVDIAVDHSPAVIQLEDLSHYRESEDNAIHDWPYAKLQEKIAYKATAEGIPVRTVPARFTSITCRMCGQTNRDYRQGPDFECSRCGYEVHADVNAAINIAQRE